jgi:two-component system, OmpR family, response regulator
VLDMMLPDFDGMVALRRLRADGDDLPVLFLTARDAVEDRVAGLTAGGDDYATKPFSLEEVVARLRAPYVDRPRVPPTAGGSIGA